MHAALMSERYKEKEGKWRKEQVWIGGGNLGNSGEDFVATHQERIYAAIEDLLKLEQRNDI